MSDRTSYLRTVLTGGEDHAPHNKLHDIAGKVQRLSPDHRDPERYFIEKGEIVAALRSIAREVQRHG